MAGLVGIRNTTLSNYDRVQMAKAVQRPVTPARIEPEMPTTQPVGPTIPVDPTPRRPIAPPDKPRDATPFIPVTPPRVEPTPTPTPKTEPQSPAPVNCPEGFSPLAAGSTRVYADGTSVKNTGSAVACYPNASSAPAKTETPAAPAPDAPKNNGPNTGGGDPVNRLIDVMASMYAGAGVKGGGSGFDGLVSAPLATSVTDTPQQASGSNGYLMLVILAVVIGLGFWYYKSHKKKAGAS